MHCITMTRTRTAPRNRIRRRAEERSAAEPAFAEEHFILCRFCGNPVTSLEHVISVQGSHRHTFTNPAGMRFTIGCFAAAEGCIVAGDPTFEHTWFKGFQWNVAVCSRCLAHLGWHYQNGGTTFFGLILRHLAETSRTH